MENKNLLDLDNPQDCEKLIGAIRNSLEKPNANQKFREEIYYEVSKLIGRYLYDNRLCDSRQERSRLSSEIAEKILNGVPFETAMNDLNQKLNLG